MTRRELIELCLAHAGVYEDYPFDEIADENAWTVMRHRSSRKSFAFIFEREGLCINLKCEPVKGDHLRQLFDAVTPAYHMNKTHWITVRPDGDVSQELLEELIDHSYDLTAKKQKKQVAEKDPV